MNCRLCNSDNIIKIHDGVRDNPFINVMRCQDCGLVFLSSTSQITDNFYQEGDMHAEGDADVDFYAWRKETYPDDKRRADSLLGK